MFLGAARQRGLSLAKSLAGSWRVVEPGARVRIDRSLADGLVRHGCGGLGFRVADPAASDGAEVERLHDAYRWNALSTRRQEQNLATAARVLESVGIEPILGKGFGVARQYPGRGFRPGGDIDLYVPVEVYDQAASALAERAPEIAIDLHRGYADLDDRDPARIRERAVTVGVEGETIRIFGFEDHLRLVCLHAARHGALRAMWLCDAGLLLESLPEDFDPAWFAQGDPQRTDMAFRVLGLAHTLLGASLDRFPRDRAHLWPPLWMEEAVLTEWGRSRIAHGARRPWRIEMYRPWRWPQAALERWPNAFEAAYATRTPVNDGGSVSVQLRACARRIQQFRAGLREASHPREV